MHPLFIPCAHCGRDFKVHPCKARERKYCSRACYAAAHAQVVAPCRTCGKSFSVPPSAIRWGGGFYCSQACYRAAPRRPDSERFWDFVQKTESCWPWTGGKASSGHGHFTLNSRVQVVASRFSWELVHGTIPDGLFVCHDCPGGDNPACVNPAHLFLGTSRDNTQDAAKKGLLPRGDTSPTRKLASADVLSIRARHRGGESQARLARDFSVTPSTIQAIVSFRNWKHL